MNDLELKIIMVLIGTFTGILIVTLSVLISNKLKFNKFW
jgi:hypothetical protein